MANELAVPIVLSRVFGVGKLEAESIAAKLTKADEKKIVDAYAKEEASTIFDIVNALEKPKKQLKEKAIDPVPVNSEAKVS